jgi:hypothetical protein
LVGILGEEQQFGQGTIPMGFGSGWSSTIPQLRRADVFFSCTSFRFSCKIHPSTFTGGFGFIGSFGQRFAASILNSLQGNYM